MRIFIPLILSCCIISVLCQGGISVATPTSGNENNETTVETTVKTDFLTTTKYENSSCEQHTTCEDCSKNHECYFCQEDNTCKVYVLKEVLPNKECKLKDVYYGTCTISLLVTIILISIASAIVLIGLITCCCCCCCRSGGRLKLSKDDLKWARLREERRMRAEEKRKERASRTEEIRRKYGLFKDDSPYHKFEA